MGERTFSGLTHKVGTSNTGNEAFASDSDAQRQLGTTAPRLPLSRGRSAVPLLEGWQVKP